MTPEQIRLLLSISKVLDKQAARADALNLLDSSGGKIGSWLGSLAEDFRSQVKTALGTHD
jgi:hypothetical protein